MKLAVIGGGSTYTPELVHGILRNSLLKEELREDYINLISLHDINPERLSVIGNYCSCLSEAFEAPVKISTCTDLEESLSNADFIVIQIRAGGNEKRAQDENSVRKLGLVAQETTGVAGFLKAYGTIPEVSKIIEKADEISPGSTIINFTNPVGIISTAIRKISGNKNIIGLCNVPVFMRKKIGEIIDDYIPDLNHIKSGFEMEWGGLNHLSWIFDIKFRGKSYLEEILKIIISENFDPEKYFPVNKGYIKRTGAIPSPYLRYYTDTKSVLMEQKEGGLRGDEVVRIEKEILGIYRNIDKKVVSRNLPDKLAARGGADYSRIAVDLINDVINGKSVNPQILNVPDEERFFGPDKNSCVEIPVSISVSGEGRLNFHYHYPDKKNICPEITDIIRKVREYETLTVAAGLERDPDKAKAALDAHPLVSSGKAAESIVKLAGEKR